MGRARSIRSVRFLLRFDKLAGGFREPYSEQQDASVPNPKRVGCPEAIEPIHQRSNAPMGGLRFACAEIGSHGRVLVTQLPEYLGEYGNARLTF